MTEELSDLADNSSLPDAPSPDAADERGAERDLLVVKAGALLFSVFAEDADGISDWRVPVPLPDAPTAVLGVTSVRGRMLTVLDPLLVLGERVEDESSLSGFIIALRGDEQLALRVDKALRIIEIYQDQVQPVPEAESRGGVVRGLVQNGNDTIIVLNIEEMFATAMRGTGK